MDILTVVELCRFFEAAGLTFWIDGGWGVDALVGEQTRQHSDLDLAVEAVALSRFEHVLNAQGYVQEIRPDDPEWNRVLRRGSNSVDLHGFWFDARGNAVLGDAEEGNMYPAGVLTGIGSIGGIAVRCVTAPGVLAFRNSFAPRAADRHDVALLCARFGLPIPDRFRSS